MEMCGESEKPTIRRNYDRYCAVKTNAVACLQAYGGTSTYTHRDPPVPLGYEAAAAERQSENNG